MQAKNLLDLQQTFNNELTCAQYLEQQRWDGTPICPHCGSEHHYRTKTRLKHPELQDYKDFVCKACMKKYSVLTGTIYESSKISLRIWFAAAYILSTHKKGISSIQMATDLGVTQKTAWFMMHRLRFLFEEQSPEILTGTVEADESFVGGKNKNRHWDKKVPHSTGRSFIDKTPVLGLLQRGGKVRCFAIPDTKAGTIQPLVLANVARGSTFYTDEYSVYNGLGQFYDHQIVDHARKQYKNGDATTNSIEGFWSILKRGIIGIYHYVSRKHLQRYCNEFTYRYNHRKLPAIERFIKAIRMCNNTRLQYKVLVG